MTARNFIDLTGQKFGRLTVIKRADNDKHGNAQWLCKCECGNETIVRGFLLKRGTTKSCGCLQKESLEKARKDRKKKVRIDTRIPCLASVAEEKISVILKMMTGGIKRILEGYRIDDLSGIETLMEKHFQKAKDLLQKEKEKWRNETQNSEQ